MSTSENNALAEDLAKSLQATTSLVQTLLGELRENATAMAVLKGKLDGIEEKVKYLSYVVRDGNGEKSLITRLALLENDLQDLEEEVQKHDEYDKEIERRLHERISNVKSMINQDNKTKAEFRREKTISYLKLAASIVPGLLALGLVLAKHFLGG